MIVKVMKGARADPGSTVRYLYGPGHTEHLSETQHRHTDPHSVAGTLHHPGVTPDALIADLRANAKFHRLRSTTKHIHHITFALSPAETAALTRPGAERPGLTDEQWQAVADDYMTRMGWDRARWVAVRHGLAADGGDHLHVVLSDVLADGSRLNMWHSGQRSQAIATGLEERHGLRVLESRRDGVSAVPLTPGEKGMERRTGAPAPRETLAGTLRAAATAASSEAEFVRLARGAGVELRPYVNKSTGLVTGYSARIGDGVWHQAGRTARDLSLPQLRAWKRWVDTTPARAEAAAEWRGRLAPVAQAPAAPVDVDRLTRDLRTAGARWRLLTPEQRAQYAGELSGALAAAGAAREAREVGRWAQTRRAPGKPARGPVGGSPFKAVAGLLTQGMSPEEKEMMRAVQQLLLALAETHRSNHTTPRRPAAPAPSQDPVRALRAQRNLALPARVPVAAGRGRGR